MATVFVAVVLVAAVLVTAILVGAVQQCHPQVGVSAKALLAAAKALIYKSIFLCVYKNIFKKQNF